GFRGNRFAEIGHLDRLRDRHAPGRDGTRHQPRGTSPAGRRHSSGTESTARARPALLERDVAVLDRDRTCRGVRGLQRDAATFEHTYPEIPLSRDATGGTEPPT